MSTAGGIITASYQMLGYTGANETLSGADSALGLDQFNKMLDSWSNENLMCYTILEQSVVMTPGKNSYTIGKIGTPDINQTRPIRIMEGPGSAYLQDGSANNYEVTVVTHQIWNQIANRGTNTTSNIPDTLWYDPQFPNGVINLWPTPTIGYTLFFDSYQQLADAATLVTQLSLPPGYELALQSNLAILLGPFVKGALVSQDIKDIARMSKANVKRSNKRTNIAQYDRELSQTAQPTYNIYSGRYR